MSRRPSDPLPISRPNSDAPEALYLQVANAIEEALRSGRLRVGDRLPAERELALELDVSRTTVTGAYQELHARGLLRGHVGRGTVIVGAPPETRNARSRGLSASRRWRSRRFRHATRRPPLPGVIASTPVCPILTLLSVETLDGLLRSLPNPPTSTPRRRVGDPVLRRRCVTWLRSRGAAREAGGILVTTGGRRA